MYIFETITPPTTLLGVKDRVMLLFVNKPEWRQGRFEEFVRSVIFCGSVKINRQSILVFLFLICDRKKASSQLKFCDELCVCE